VIVGSWSALSQNKISMSICHFIPGCVIIVDCTISSDFSTLSSYFNVAWRPYLVYVDNTFCVSFRFIFELSVHRHHSNRSNSL
jgi:hypothetical protein